MLNNENIRVKQYDNGLKVIKYKNKVFFKNLWDEDTVNARGLVLDEDNNIVNYPFTKVYNLGENGTTVDPERMVICPRKVNGFMACATMYKGELLISTTGSLDSDFVKLAKKYIHRIPDDNRSYMFEICDPSDPHIVPEEAGAYLIGARKKELNSELEIEDNLDYFALVYDYKRPKWWKGKFKDLPLDVKHEGYMVRDFQTEETLCKIKSKHYLFTKFWMRSKKAYNVQEVEEEFFELVGKIRDTFTEEEWSDLDQQERRTFIEENL